MVGKGEITTGSFSRTRPITSAPEIAIPLINTPRISSSAQLRWFSESFFITGFVQHAAIMVFHIKTFKGKTIMVFHQKSYKGKTIIKQKLNRMKGSLGIHHGNSQRTY
jgi:hypothetical protein